MRLESRCVNVYEESVQVLFKVVVRIWVCSGRLKCWYGRGGGLHVRASIGVCDMHCGLLESIVALHGDGFSVWPSA